MKRIHILHLSDLHCEASPETAVVPKSKTLSEGFIKEITGSSMLNQFLSYITHLALTNPVDLIAFTGDLGVGAKEHTLAFGIEYLDKLAKDIGIPPECVIVCPGNHDLDRKVTDDTELKEFCNHCKEKGFSFSNRTVPAVVNTFGPPIIVLNSCLGGTQHALYGDLPEGFWKSVKENLKDLEKKLVADDILSKVKQEWQSQLKDMDIPALGHSQLDEATRALVKSSGNCAVILMHHNVLPTSKVDIRPYANVIDSGRLILNLVEQGRRVVLLHGHTHCDSGLSVFPHLEDKGGFVAAIGSRGLLNETNAAANLIELWLTNDNEFIKLKVAFVERVGDDFRHRNQYVLFNRYLDKKLDELEWKVRNGLELNKSYTFVKVAEILGRPADDELAEKLIQLDPSPLEITGLYAEKINDLRINRIR